MEYQPWFEGELEVHPTLPEIFLIYSQGEICRCYLDKLGNYVKVYFVNGDATFHVDYFEEQMEKGSWYICNDEGDKI